MNDGHTVVGIDGLKIEPLPPAQSGVDGGRRARAASRRCRTSPRLREDLGERAMAGFGGVAEYGITVRWDKNYLKMVRLLLERRGAVLDVRRRALRRHGHGRGRLRHGLRPRRAVRRRRQADRARHAQRPGARRARGVGLPDGAAAHRRGQEGLHRQPADPPAGGGDRRRPDRHRHRDRIARLLPAAGREVPGAPRDAGRRARRGGGARALERRRSARSPTNSSPMPRRSAPSARRRRARAASPRSPAWSTAGAASPSPIAGG